MEFNVNLYGDVENPLVEIPGKRGRANELYSESPLYAFLISIPHCIATMFQSIAKEEGIKVKTCKVRAKYDLDEKALILGKYIIRKITIEVYGDCDKDELDELVEKVKQNCPIYLSFNDKIVVVPRYNF
jgi:uncharacterized OsmC-like protein